ncbi:MAG: restriction endonuclease subunit S [Candidatus Woesearchaeota archaeon]
MTVQTLLLKEICTIRTGYQKKALEGNKYKLLKLTNLNEDGSIDLNDITRFGKKEINSRYLLEQNDILFKAKSSQNAAGLFKVEDNNVVASGHFFILSIKDDYKGQINPGYIAWYLREEKAQRHFKKFAAGMAMPAVRKSDLQILEVSLPPIELQNIISETYELMLEEKKLLNTYMQNRTQQIKGLLKSFL